MVKLVQFNLKIDWWYSMAQKFITNFILKTKSAPTEADAQKTQTPIVAKPIDEKARTHICLCRTSRKEFAFLSNSV